jgi:hypothetical protein
MVTTLPRFWIPCCFHEVFEHFLQQLFLEEGKREEKVEEDGVWEGFEWLYFNRQNGNPQLCSNRDLGTGSRGGGKR